MNGDKPDEVLQAIKTIEEELAKQLGEQAKTILEIVEEMLRLSKPREEILAMLSDEISKCIVEKIIDQRLFH